VVAFATLGSRDVPVSSVQPRRLAEVVTAGAPEKICGLVVATEFGCDICSFVPGFAFPIKRKGALEVTVAGLQLRRAQVIAAVDQGPHEALLRAGREEELDEAPHDEGAGNRVGHDHDRGVRHKLHQLVVGRIGERKKPREPWHVEHRSQREADKQQPDVSTRPSRHGRE